LTTNHGSMELVKVVLVCHCRLHCIGLKQARDLNCRVVESTKLPERIRRWHLPLTCS
jgi:hypothetical protein